AIPGIVSTGNPNVLNGPGCSNCYSIPKGQNGTGLTWAQLTANGANTTNLVNPNLYAWATPADQKTSATMTFDYTIIPGVQFTGEAFSSNRRDQSAGGGTTLTTAAIPTTYPYYPVGAPAGLRVSISLAPLLPPLSSAYEISQRYSGGFTVKLPGDWQAKL